MRRLVERAVEAPYVALSSGVLELRWASATRDDAGRRSDKPIVDLGDVEVRSWAGTGSCPLMMSERRTELIR